MKRTTLLFCLLFVSTISAYTQIVLDTTFGEGGRFIHHFSTGPNYARLQSTALLPDGKILGVGETINGSSRAAAIRCTADGVLDTSFGDQGEWICDEPNFFIADNVVVQPDGKILLTGYNDSSFVVVRLLPNGVYDLSFGNGGKAYFKVWPGTQGCKINDLGLQSDGKIVVCGFSLYTDAEAMVARLNVNGTVDSTFGDFGSRSIQAAALGGARVMVSRIGVGEDDQIIASGFYSPTGQAAVGYVVRYQANGQLDATFGDNGVTRIPFMSPIGDVFVLPTLQSLLLCGVYDTLENVRTTALYRLRPDGKIDSIFADNGRSYFPTDNGSNTPRNGFLQPDGEVMVFGNLNAGLGFLGRFNSDGSIDKTIGPNGTLITTEYYADGFVQPDGKIVTAGPFTFSGPTEEASILRYTGAGTLGVPAISANMTAATVHPNPIGYQPLQIEYTLSLNSHVTIELLDATGKKITTLLETERPLGKNKEVVILPQHLTNGLYLLRLRTPIGDATTKVYILRS